MADLAAYIRHAELYGPERVLETAGADPDVSRTGLGELKGYLDSRLRLERWYHGRWVERREKERRPCAFCGLDLPRDANANTRYHGHCRQTAQRRRSAETRKRAEARKTTGSPAKARTPGRPRVRAKV
jgi:hypothetical protein